MLHPVVTCPNAAYTQHASLAWRNHLACRGAFCPVYLPRNVHIEICKGGRIVLQVSFGKMRCKRMWGFAAKSLFSRCFILRFCLLPVTPVEHSCISSLHTHCRSSTLARESRVKKEIKCNMTAWWLLQLYYWLLVEWIKPSNETRELASSFQWHVNFILSHYWKVHSVIENMPPITDFWGTIDGSIARKPPQYMED